VSQVNHGIDRLHVTFDDDSLVADAGLVLVATLVARLGLEGLIDQVVRLAGRVGGARPGRKVLTIVHAMIAGADCIDDTDRLRSGSTASLLGHRVIAPSTLGTFLRSFTFGHVRQLEAVVDRAIERAWKLGAGPAGTLTIDVDSTICEVHGYAKQGAAYGYTRVLGYHPLLATRADTGEVRDEGVVAPRVEQLALSAVVVADPAHDQAAAPVAALGHMGVAIGVVDALPRPLIDRVDRSAHRLALMDRDRETDTCPRQPVQHVVAVEP